MFTHEERQTLLAIYTHIKGIDRRHLVLEYLSCHQLLIHICLTVKKNVSMNEYRKKEKENTMRERKRKEWVYVAKRVRNIQQMRNR